MHHSQIKSQEKNPAAINPLHRQANYLNDDHYRDLIDYRVAISQRNIFG